MPTEKNPAGSWKNKPSDRFVLRWIKYRLCARISPALARVPGLAPWMLTAASAALGVTAGALFALRLGWQAGLVAAASQILDGADGQVARLTGRATRAGAFLDSVLDRYADGAMVIGLTVYAMRLGTAIPVWLLLAVGFLAISGSNLMSYGQARADSLGIDLGALSLASKGTRTTIVVLCGIGSAAWRPLPVAALCYLAVHPNVETARRLLCAFRSSDRSRADSRSKKGM